MGLPENIDVLLSKYDITQEQLAKIAGVTPSSVSHWRNGVRIRKAPLDKICSHFGLTEDDLLSDRYGLAGDRSIRQFSSIKPIPITAKGRATVPLLTMGKVHAGTMEDEEEARIQVDVPLIVFDSHPKAFALIVEGDCMNKHIPAGALVLVDPHVTPINGSIIVAENEHYQAIMRRYYKGNDTLILSADSYEKYDDIVFREGSSDAQIRLIGVVVWYQSKKVMK